MRYRLALALLLALAAFGDAFALARLADDAHRSEALILLCSLLAAVVAISWQRRRLDQVRQEAQALWIEQQSLRQNEERFRALVWNASDAVVIVDLDAAIRYQSPATERLWGYGREALRGRSVLELIHPEDLAQAQSLFVQSANSPRLSLRTELRLQHTDGSWCHFEVTLNNLLRDPAVAGIVATFRDISERKAFEAELAHQAFHDALTKLPNRTLFADRLERALARVPRHARSIAVLFLDLDNFKLVNDSLGHPAGDRLLIEVADRLRTTLRREDTAARLGGDEFAILLEGVRGIGDARTFAERIQEQLRRAFVLDGQEVFTTVSIGIAMSDGRHEQPDDLVREADLALYEAKGNGKACHASFQPGMNTRASARLTLETDLRFALERDEFQLNYQPIVDLHTGRICQLEALVRWTHPSRGQVTPTEFIPVAEESGLILPLGRWVLEEACRQTRAWQLRHPSLVVPAVSVNISAREFQQVNLVDEVRRVLTRTGLAASSLQLEITESVMMRDAESTTDTLRGLKELGASLSIDDFGTGYSSLAYLERFPIDGLKIDRSFVDRLGHEPEDAAIVRTIITLAKALKLVVTSEGIETPRQLAELRALGSDRGQGWYFARAVPAHEIEELLTESGDRTPTLAMAS